MGGGNPFLDDIISRSANEAAGSVAQKFAASGRYGSGRFSNAVADAVDTVGTKLRYDDYSTERDRQAQAATAIDSAGLARAGLAGNLLSTVAGINQGTSGTIVPDQPAPSPGPAPTTAPLPPQRPAGLASAALGEARADLPAPGAVPMQMPRFDATAPAAPVASASPPAPAAEPPGFGTRLGTALTKMGESGFGDQLLALGAGLLSGPGWSGAAKGIAGMGEASQRSGANDLAKLRGQMEVAKFQREGAAIGGNAAILKRAYPNLSDAEAQAQGSNSAAVTEALKILRDPNHGRENDPANIRARAQATAEGTALGKPDETYTPLSEADRVARGLPPGAYQIDSKQKVSPINQTGTTINMGVEKAQDSTVGKGYGEYQLDLATKGRNAGSTLNTLNVMEQAMSAPGFYSGLGAEQIKQANQLLGALGVKDSRAASGAEVFDALSNKVVLDGLGGSLGPGISNTDRDYIGRTAATLARSGEGNRALIGIARDLAQRQQVVSKLARDYAAKNGGRLDAGFDQVLDDFAQATPLFPQAKANATASPPNEPPKGAPAGARQAPDGQFYVPDPNRPGKYLKVQ